MVKFNRILIVCFIIGNLKSSARAGLLDGLGLVVNNQPISTSTTHNNNLLGSALSGLTNGLTMTLLGPSRRVDTLNSNIVPINSGVIPIHSNAVPIHSEIVPIMKNGDPNTVIVPLSGNEYGNRNMIIYPIQNYPNSSPNTNLVSNFGNKNPIHYLNHNQNNHNQNINSNVATKLAEAQRLYYDKIKELNRLKDLQKVQYLLNLGKDNKNNQEETTVPLEKTTEISKPVTETSNKQVVDVTTETIPTTTIEVKKEEEQTTLSSTTQSIVTTENTLPILKSLTKTKFYYPMLPVIPENEITRSNETVYYFK